MNGSWKRRPGADCRAHRSRDRQERRSPTIEACLALCHVRGATLIVAKLDRLARNVKFLATLMDDGGDFLCCDMPSANKLTIHILAAVAQAEAEMISARIKAALEAAKPRGVRLGGHREGAFVWGYSCSWLRTFPRGAPRQGCQVCRSASRCQMAPNNSFFRSFIRNPPFSACSLHDAHRDHHTTHSIVNHPRAAG